MWQVLVYWLFSGLWSTGAVSYCKISGHRKPYDPTRSICCDARLHNRTNDERLYCCGQSLYSPATSICCDGRLHGISRNTAKPQCCKGISYDADRFICCDGGLRKRRFRHTACCKNKTMDITTQVCCEGKVRPSTEGRTACCGTRSYNLYKDTCCNRNVNLNIVTKACCMKQAYDKSVSTCCGGHLTQKVGLQCCGNEFYNQKTHACCGGNVTIKNNTTGCCCKQGICTLYSTDQQICCGGMVVPNDGHTACCGTDIYDVTMQVCCGNITLGAGPSNWRCCRNTPYDSNKHICCTNKIQPKTNQNMRCCGNKAYDPDKFQCEDYFYSHVMPIKGRFCGRLIYNPDVELCCQASVVLKKYGQRTACCKKQAYDTNRYVCCDGVMNHIPTGIPQCCRRNAYDVLKHKCDFTSGQIMSRTNKFVRFCGERMMEYDTRVSRCCNGTTYGPGNVCCQGKVAKLPGIRLGQGKCCGPYPYHDDKHTCCDRSLYNNLEGNKCCGTKPYNSSTHACCRGNIYPAGFTCCEGVVHPTPGVQPGKGRCCGGIGYNRRRQICCAKKVFPRPSRKMKCCGARPYDKSRNIFICCHATLSVISSHGRNVCCGKEAYNPTMETCCRGRIHMKSNATCCGRNIYDPFKAICCSNTAVYPKDKYGRECCRKVAFNASTHYCRSGSILPKLLCRKKIYDNRTQMCCDGRIHPSGAHMNCCGKKRYNSVQSICCRGKIRPNTRICCSDRPYRAKTFGCCGGLALRKDHPHLKCCAGRVYKATHYRCKRNTIVNKEKLRKKMCTQQGAFVFLGELKTIGKVHHSFKILSVIKGELKIQVKSIVKVSYKKTSRRIKNKTGQNYLVAGLLVLKDSFIVEKVFLYRPWRKKLLKKLVALVESCHLVRPGAADPSVTSHFLNAFRGV